MANDALKQVAQDFKTVAPKMAEAQELIDAMKESGEDTSQMETDLRKLRQRALKWERMLKAKNLL